jgi:hypothetical protein
MQSELLRLLRIAESRPCLSKQPILDEVRRIAAMRLWEALTVAQRAYAFGLVGKPLPATLDWDAMPLESQLAISRTVLQWSPAFVPTTAPTNAKPAARSVQAEPGPPALPVGC